MSESVTPPVIQEIHPSEPPGELLFPSDHAKIAGEHFLAQHIGKNKTEEFVKAFYPPLNQLDMAYQQMYQLRWIESCRGEQLDLAGSIVGVGRVIPNSIYLAFFGFYTQYAGRGFYIARLRRRGEHWAESTTLNDEAYRVLISLKVMMNNGHGTAAEIAYAVNVGLGINGTYINDTGNASFEIVLTDMTIPEDDPRLQLIDYVVLRAAGVRMRFKFAYNTMWDRGHSIWDEGKSIWDEDVVP